ncbi:hypothetical protein ML603_08420 [Streptococcus dysgalactiae subsp. equisimilis]|uniref:hypothetical protein n=1 Tax=Streptococcus dysgalactiae TaxID=1334 RepID=UPI0012AA6501|nr:hypothetical protein [Streptococcus dysgalactiae]MCB2832760.1 hypothetical protein [Streptococcus dysgalactiae subsp. dysgalactiae]QGH03232.1 hypothetical protein EA458_01085 [Streptococcus dysgalactiae subsp. dysgalactiae]UMY67894.1 hypothetical protein ML603_08420 [Streptococcus dysgalactiae subsp. equisimilis]
MEKLTLKKEKENTATLPFFVGIDLHAQIKEISTETGIPMRRIIEKMIRFSLDNLEIMEGD